MQPATSQQDERKREAAVAAATLVRPGMVVGLGSGSTSLFAILELGRLLREGGLRDIVGFATSLASAAEARRQGIPLVDDENPPAVDLTIDGADEVDGDLNLIKGGGGALLREKIVAQASRREVIIVDDSKLSPRLGTRWPVPIEVIPFAWGALARFIESLGGQPARRLKDGKPYLTDQGNFILDSRFGPLERPAELAEQLQRRAGIVEHGLFLGLATDCIVAAADGIKHLTRDRASMDKQ